MANSYPALLAKKFLSQAGVLRFEKNSRSRLKATFDPADNANTFVRTLASSDDIRGNKDPNVETV